MITRSVLEAKRGLYIQERERLSAEIFALNGAIGAMEDLLRLLDDTDAATKANNDAAEAAEENKDG